MKKEKFSLKDELFNPAKVEYLAGLVLAAYPEFSEKEFIQRVIEKFPELELKERIFWIRENLQKFLPEDFQEATEILLKSLPPELDPSKTDDDFGDFIFAPLSDFVAIYGCDENNLEFSLNALERMTKNFSCEDSIRFFLRKFSEKTVQKMQDWSRDANYHVRRLASEGSRPKLPWSQKVDLSSPQIIQKILENLCDDSTRYVVRSVANHLNDIAKDDADLVIKTLKKWKISREISDFLLTHSLRTLIKKGNPGALELLGYSPNPEISLGNLKISTSLVQVGNALEFSGEIISLQKNAEKNMQNLMIDYVIHFVDKSGKNRPKVFKLKKSEIFAGEKIFFQKKHPLRVMTTKKLYAGMHFLEIQINGKILGKQEFELLL